MNPTMRSTSYRDMDITAETPLLERMHTPFGRRTNSDILGEKALSESTTTFLIPSVAFARRDKYGRVLPQAIAHRGYKAKHPENTMGAFKGAVGVGAQAIETDIHLSKDGVVVLSHDANLKRCFGVDEKIIDHNWDYLSTLRTLKEPHEPMPRLQDLLEYLASPGLEDIWLLLDIKLDNNANDVIKLIADTIRNVSSPRPWEYRILLGCWTAKYLPLCEEYLPGFPITHIGFSTLYARQFFCVPNISFNMLQFVLMGPLGWSFRRKAKELGRPVLVWTVNEESKMKWCIKKNLDGVITDDPKKFIDVRDDWEEREPGCCGQRDFGFFEYLYILWVNLVVVVFATLFMIKVGFRGVDLRFKRKLIQ